jgi:hypothetical protein
VRPPWEGEEGTEFPGNTLYCLAVHLARGGKLSAAAEVQVYCLGTIHLATQSICRTLVFKQHLLVHTAMLLAALCCAWNHCLPIGCKHGSSFRAASDMLLWLLFPALAASSMLPYNLMAAGEGSALAALASLGAGAKSEEESCMADCFVVHGTAMVVGYFFPLLSGERVAWGCGRERGALPASLLVVAVASLLASPLAAGLAGDAVPPALAAQLAVSKRCERLSAQFPFPKPCGA